MRGEGRLVRQIRWVLDGLTDEILGGGRPLESTVRARRPSGTLVNRIVDRRSRLASSSNCSGTTGSQGRWARSVRAGTMQRWNRISRCCRIMSRTVSGGSHARSFCWQSRPRSDLPPPPEAKTLGKLAPIEYETINRTAANAASNCDSTRPGQSRPSEQEVDFFALGLLLRLVARPLPMQRRP